MRYVSLRNALAIRFQDLIQCLRKIQYLCMSVDGRLFAVLGMVFTFRTKRRKWAVLAYPDFLLDCQESPG